MIDHSNDSHAVAERLTLAGLLGPVFDVDEVATDYADRMEMDRTLDALIGPGDPGAVGRTTS